MSDLSILYVGSLATWCNSLRRFQAITRIDPSTESVDTDPYILAKYISGFQHHLNIGPGVSLLNVEIRKRCRRKQYDIILVDNKPFLSRKTMKYIKQKNPDIKIANLLTDDPFGKFKRSWPVFKRTARFYDIIFVQRKVNISELKNLGVKRVEICYRSYDPAFHRPLQLTDDDLINYKSTVGFVGTYESFREEFVVYLIQNNIPVKITGDGWPKGKYWKLIEPNYQGNSTYGESYIKTINGMDIALHFLRHGNRDEQDSRTFEIPACGVFMLAEKSDTHLSLFEDGSEAVFFSTKEQLLEKVKYFLEHQDERKAIARAGLARCLQSGYSHEGRLSQVLHTIEML